MASSTRWSAVLCFAIIFLFSVQAQGQIHQIAIRSSWGGLGPHADTTIVITPSRDGYTESGQPIARALVNTLVATLREPVISKPDLASLGVTQQWLNANAESQKPHSSSAPGDPTPGQRDLFEKSFSDQEVIARVFPKLFQGFHTDDYPAVRVEVTMDDNSKLVAYSRSQFAFMLPWCVGPDEKASYNSAISHAVSALLPKKTVNKNRLATADLASELSEAVMSEIESAYDLQGVDDKVGSDLSRLRRSYSVTFATIDPYLRPEYGPDRFNAKHQEINLHATLHKESFPVNVVQEVTLQDLNGHIQGIDRFLASADKYEELVLSVPWLNEYILEHPKTEVRLTYVHEASLCDQALRRFAADMKLRKREDLAAKVKAQQKEIALIQVGRRYAESYWLVFPDKHSLLWRYQGRGGLLKWDPSDFGEGKCAEEGVNNGGCSGREVAPDGTLIREGTPHDVGCVQVWRAEHPQRAGPPNALFDVMEHDRGGFIDSAGTIAIPLCFEAVGDFSEGLARFERDGRWGYLDSVGNVVIQPVFPWAEEFHEGLAHVQAAGSPLGYEGRWGYIDKSGTMVIPPIYSQILGDTDGDESAFHEGFAIVEIEGDKFSSRKGFIDHTGKLEISARFTYVYPFAEGVAAATESENAEGGWGYIDKAGNWAVAPQFDWASSFRFDLAPVNRKRDCGYIDKSGTRVLELAAPSPPEDCASAWGDFTDGLSRWRYGSHYGFIDRKGNLVIPARFDLTFGFSEGLAAVQIGKRWGFIDTSGKMVIPLQDFSSVKPFHNGLSRVVVERRGVGYIDRAGKFVWGPREMTDRTAQ